MKAEIIQSLTDDFESHAKHTENGVEFWLARDSRHLLGYEKWDNFESALAKAKVACEVARENGLHQLQWLPGKREYNLVCYAY